MTINDYISARKKSWDSQAEKPCSEGYGAKVVANNTGWKVLKYDITPYLKLLPKRFKKVVALDLGCGVGRLIGPALTTFKSVIGVDISPNVIKGANEYFKKHNVDTDCVKLVVLGPDGAIAGDDSSVDFAYSCMVLQHNNCRNVRYKLYSEVSRLLRPKGMACFQYSYGDISVGRASDINEGNNQPNWSFLNEDEIKEEFMGTSFKVVGYEIVDNPPPHNTWVYVTLRNTK